MRAALLLLKSGGSNGTVTSVAVPVTTLTGGKHESRSRTSWLDETLPEDAAGPARRQGQVRLALLLEPGR